jgi:hypothetical protein
MKNTDQTQLNLTIKKEWFDMIRSGEKKEEYREIKAYWEIRLEKPRYAPFVTDFKNFKTVKFTNGYSNSSPYCIVQCLEINLGEGKLEWGAKPDEFYYVIKLGEVLIDSTLN